MKQDRELVDFMQTPAQRRCWLLLEALRCLPLDRAIELARGAEAFITGPDTEHRSDPIAPTVDAMSRQQPIEDVGAEPTIERRAAEPRPSFLLSPERRDQLLDRLAQGARNAELASEFGLTVRQVQGVRMGSARDIAKRRNRHGNAVRPSSDLSHERASAEDIVRYLRQQDDVVVSEGEAAFRVNGRFRLELVELVERANKMRRRQGKPEFQLTMAGAVEKRMRSSTQHPMFWEEGLPGTRDVVRAS